MQNVRIGIIGAGAIAEYAHAASYASTDGVEIVSISDVNQERAHQLAKRYHIPRVYENADELFERGGIDAVSICTPNALHASQTVAALRSGLHVLVEKPISATSEEADEMIRVSKEEGRLLMVGFTHRFFDHNVYVKQQIDEGAIGKPLLFRMRFAHNGPYDAQSWGAKSPWFFNKASAGGGALLDLGIHAIDLLRHFGGELKSVQSDVANLKHDIGVEDYAGALFEFESGARGQLDVGWYSQIGFNGYEIYGTEGTIINNYSTVRVHRAGGDEEDWIETVPGKRQSEIEKGRGTRSGWGSEIQFFVDSVRAGVLPYATAEDGKAALEWALRMYRGKPETPGRDDAVKSFS